MTECIFALRFLSLEQKNRVIFRVIWGSKPLNADFTQKKLPKRSTTPPGRPESGFKGVGGEMSPVNP